MHNFRLIITLFTIVFILDSITNILLDKPWYILGLNAVTLLLIVRAWALTFR